MDTARQELLARHAADRAAHVATDAAALIATQRDPLISVRAGEITTVTRAAAQERFSASFADATYTAWDDLQPPLVEVAQDGSLGWVITRTQVHRSQPDANGIRREQPFIFAGITTDARHADGWVQTTNVSTCKAGTA